MLYNSDFDKIDELLKEVEQIAIDEFDGHLSIMRFTTCWKGFFGTVDLFSTVDPLDENRGIDGSSSFSRLFGMPRYEDLGELLCDMIEKKPRFPSSKREDIDYDGLTEDLNS